jgi:hypothetical protein
VPAEYASFPLFEQLFTRISVDDGIEFNVSTFSSEMREMAFILTNISRWSFVIVDELGRGTSSTDGLAISLAICGALVESRVPPTPGDKFCTLKGRVGAGLRDRLLCCLRRISRRLPMLSKEDLVSRISISILKYIQRLSPPPPNTQVKNEQVIAMSYQLKDGIVNEDHYGPHPRPPSPF